LLHAAKMIARHVLSSRDSVCLAFEQHVVFLIVALLAQTRVLT